MSNSDADSSYMAMLNNPVINPGAPSKTVSEPTANTRLKPCVFPAVEQAQELLTTASEDVYLMSESDEPFEWINTSTEQDRLPTTEEELVQLGLIDLEDLGGGLRIKSIQKFLNRDEYKDIVAAFEQIQKEESDDSKVYLLGEESVTVLILCIVQDKQSSKKAIIGLKSLLVQT